MKWNPNGASDSQVDLERLSGSQNLEQRLFRAWPEPEQM